MRLPGTLSARITVGFTVLVVTFGGVSIYTLWNIAQLNQAIRIIRIGYWELALSARDLADRQDALTSYLKDELVEETSLRRVRSRVGILRRKREEMLVKGESVLRKFREMDDVPAKHLHTSENSLAAIRRLVNKTDELYAALLEAPPIERLGSDGSPPGTEPAVAAAGREALSRLRQIEPETKTRTDYFKDRLSRRVRVTSEELERISRQVSLFTIICLVIATAIGIFITVGATLTLRPLRRLRLAAQRIARGDYAERIQVGGARDISELAREFNVMVQAVHDRERELIRSERLATVGKMAAMITHEVRNPLSSIGLNTELLEEELAALPEDRRSEARALCQAITQEVDRLTEITEEYLQFARLPKPKLQEESVNRIISGLIEFERDALAARQVEVSLELSEQVPTLPLDEAQIRQALRNLVLNAADALQGQEGGRVSISTSYDPSAQTTTIAVEDDGPGIPEEISGRIFEPFVSHKKGGTGLGLALSQQIVREHAGTIEVGRSAAGGARFSILLPHLEIGAGSPARSDSQSE